MTEKPKGPGRSPLLFIFLTVFIDLLGFGIVLPLLPVYSLDPRYHLSETSLGLLFASYSGMQLIFAPLWGRLSDRVGRRPVLIGGLLGTAGSYVLFAFANSATLLFASRFLAGFFGANVSTAQAYIADVTEEADRARGMGLIGAAFGLGFTFGPLVGGELTAYSIAAPGLFAAGLSLTAATLGFFKLPEPPRHADVASSGRRGFGLAQIRHAFSNGRLGLLFVLSYLFLFSFSGFESMFARFGLERYPTIFRLSAETTVITLKDVMRAAPVAGRYLAFIGIVSAVIQGGFIRRLVPRFGETRLAIAGPLFLSASFLVVAFAPNWWVVLAGCALMPFGIGLNNPAVFGLISRASPADRQGSYLGLNQSVSSLARMTGPVAAGALFQTYGPGRPFVVGAVILACSGLVATVYHSRYADSFKLEAPAEAAEAAAEPETDASGDAEAVQA